MISQSSISCFVLPLIVALAAPAAMGDQKADAALEKRIAALIVQLDDDDFSVREDATEALIELGEPATAAMSRLKDHTSAEVRLRAQTVLQSIGERAVIKGFEQIARQTADEKIDLEDGIWLIAKLIDPTADRKATSKRLDELADTVRKRLGKGIDPAKADPAKVIAAVRQVIFKEEGFTGFDNEEPDPKHSAIHRVLESKRGLPILLSHVVVAVGDRLGVPIVGLQIPGRYMCKYDGSRAPKGSAKDDIILDPFGGGEVVTTADIRELTGINVTDEHLKPSGKRDTLTRMLTNVQNHYSQAGDEANTARVTRFLKMLEKKEDSEKE